MHYHWGMTEPTTPNTTETAAIDFVEADAKLTDAVVVGTGPVGMFTAFQLGLQGVQAHMVDALPAMGGQCIELYADKPIYDIPGIPVCTGRELAERLHTQITPFAPIFHGHTQVAQLLPHGDGRWRVQLVAVGDAEGTAAHWLLARTVFVTAGVGAFVPKLLRTEGIAPLVGGQVFYHPSLTDAWLAQRAAAGPLQHIVIHGGDEAAVQAALDAASHPALQGARISLLHRRDQFNAPPALLDALAALRSNGAVQVVAGMLQGVQAVAAADDIKNDSLTSANNGRMAAISYINPEGEAAQLPADQLWVYQGISPKLGPVAEWGLALEKKQLLVATDTFQTSATGIYAAGDIVTYPGKRKLIATGFYEATMAAMAAVEYLAGEKLLLEYTTTSKRLHARLGVSPAE